MTVKNNKNMAYNSCKYVKPGVTYILQKRGNIFKYTMLTYEQR